MARTPRQIRPGVDGLERRQLLSTRGLASPAAIENNPYTVNPLTFRSFTYYAPSGAKVSVFLMGSGNLAGTNVATDGGLNLVYGGTNMQSKILVNVSRGTAPLDSVVEANLAVNDYTGVGGQLLGSLVAPQLDLVPFGQINMTSGVGRLQLHSVATNSQIHLRDLPVTTLASLQQGTSPIAGSNGIPITIPSFTGLITANGGTTGTVVQGTFGVGNGLNSSTLTSTAAATGATSVVTSTIVIGGNSQQVTIPPGQQAVNPVTSIPATAPSTYTFAGRTLTYSNNAETGATTLTSASGTFTPTLNLISTPNPANPGPNPQPPGIIVQLGRVNAVGGSIGGGSIFGYDPKINGLVRFDTIDGSAVQVIPVGGTPTNVAGVGLGRDNGALVVLLARGTTVQVFDAVSGGPLGTFSTSNLASLGMTEVTGVAYNGSATVLTSPNPLTANVGTPIAGDGIAVSIDVATSLQNGFATVVGKPFGTDDGFAFAGGSTGVTVTNSVYATGGAPFNSFQPLNSQEGVQTLSGATAGSFRSNGMTAFSNPNNSTGLTPFFPFGSTARTKTDAGSAENLIAVDTGVSGDTNTVTLYTPTLGSAGTLALADANPLVALSETAHTELGGSALVDVQGNVQTLQASTAKGLAANVAGNLDLVQIRNASDSTIVGNPLSHVQIGHRSNVLLVTTSRAVGMRNGVIVDPGLRPLGPLSMPNIN
jgi:hypothetical protein